MKQQILYYNFKKLNNNKNKKGPIKILENKGKISTNLNNSFSKEFTSISEDLYDDDEDNLLAQSYSFSQINKYREEVLKEPLKIVLDTYLSSKEKNNKKKKIKFITQKDISKLNNKLLTKELDQGKEEKKFLEKRNILQDYKLFNEKFKEYLDEKETQVFHNYILYNVYYSLNTKNPTNNISPIFTLEHLFNEIVYNTYQRRNFSYKWFIF